MTTKSKEQKSASNCNTIPTINERLGYLRPSRELLEYYRKKIGEYDVERDDLIKKIDKFKQTLDDQHKLQWELRQRDDEIAELQKAISDMQVFLFQEREQVLKLYAENDRLKIQELQDRKKINRLLSLAGVNEHEVTYFIKEPPGKLIVAQKHTSSSKSTASHDDGPKQTSISDQSATIANGKYPRDYESLLLQISSLETQIAEQTKLSREQTDALLEDRKTRQEESEAQRVKDAHVIKQLREKLLQSQQLLHESTKDFLDLKYSSRQCERRWMHEKDRLLQELDKSAKHEHIKDDEILFVAQEPSPTLADEEKKHYEQELASLQEELKQTHQLAEMYREQVLKLEDQVSKHVEQGDVTRELFKSREDKLAQRLRLTTERYKELEKRRHMEVEGFKTDLKLLRDKLRQVEKQLFRASVNGAGGVASTASLGGVDDGEVLKSLHETTVKSREMQGELQHLKAKIYALENDIRHL